MTLITISAVVVAVAVVLTYNRRVWRPRQPAARVPQDGLKAWEMTAPFASLAVLLLVFVAPAQTEFVRDQMASEVKGPLPCDDAGMPTDIRSFRATTVALG